MRFTPILLVMVGVVVVIGDNRVSSNQYGSVIQFHGPKQRFESRNEWVLRLRVQPDDNPRGNSHGQEYRNDHGNRSKVVLTARGVMSPVFVPRNLDGSINFKVIPEYAEFLVHNDVKGVQIFSLGGEGPALSLDDKEKLIEEWVKVGKKLNLHVMVEVGGVPYPDVIATAKYAQVAGADSLSVLPQVYYKPATIEELVQYIGEVSKAAPHLPVVYFHETNRTGVVYPPSEIVRIATARVPNFKGIKYETDDLSQLTATLNELKPDQELFLAADRLIAPAALLGVRSALSGSLSFWSRLAHEILVAVEHNDVKRARQLQGKLTSGFDAILAAGNALSAERVAMEIVTGIKLGPPGRPLPEITEAARQRLEYTLSELGLIVRTEY